MGIYTGDWSYAAYRKAVTEALVEGRDSVAFCTEHCSSCSDELLKKWAEDDGFPVKVRMDDIIAHLR